MTRVVALIPARSGSKGVPDKNIKLLGEHSLLEWSIAACLRAKLIDRTIVSTDSPVYAGLAKEAGAEAPFLRPPEIASDTSTDYEFIRHAIEWLISTGDTPDLIVHIRPTSPLRDPMVIDKAISEFKQSSSFTALRSVHKMPESAYKAFEISSNHCLKSLCSDNTELDRANNPRQGFPDTFVANGYVDVISVPFVLSNKAIHGNKVLPFFTELTHEIDVEEDFDYLKYRITTNKKYKQLIFHEIS